MPRQEHGQFIGNFNDPAGSILRYGDILFGLTGRMVEDPANREAYQRQLDDTLLDFLSYRKGYKTSRRDPFPTRKFLPGKGEVEFTEVLLFRGQDREAIHPESRNQVIVRVLVPNVGGETGLAEIREFQTDLHRLAQARSRRTTEHISGSGFVNSHIVYRDVFEGKGQEDTPGIEQPAAYAFRSITELAALRAGLDGGRVEESEHRRGLGQVANRIVGLSQHPQLRGDIQIRMLNRFLYRIVGYGQVVDVDVNLMPASEKSHFLRSVGQGGRRN